MISQVTLYDATLATQVLPRLKGEEFPVDAHHNNLAKDLGPVKINKAPLGAIWSIDGGQKN